MLKVEMVFEFRLPDIGEGIAEAEIIEWMVSEGDTVKADQTIVKIETDKAVADLPCPVSGTILKINFSKGDTVNVGAVICVIGESGEKVISKIVREKIVEKKNFEEKRVSSASGKVLALPAVRKAAAEKGINLESVKGSGENGMILMSDLDKNSFSELTEIIETSRPNGINAVRKYDQFGYIERIPMKGVRKAIAQNMINSLSQSAQVTSMEDIDVSKLWNIRLREKEHFAIEGVKLTFIPFVMKALVKSLQKHPILNSSLEGDNIVIKKYYNVGIAVQTDVGLLVPVVKIAERKSISDIAKEVEDLAEKSRNRTIDVMDLKGSTFTITNYGSVGGTYATPIINPGEAAILGLGRIFDRAIFDEKTGKVRNAKILPISVTFDHQILDGIQATEFMKTLKGYLEDPDHLLVKD